MATAYILVVLLSVFSQSIFVKAEESDGEPEVKSAFSPRQNFPVGDYRNCMWNEVMPVRLETLPGLGWDNLRNRVSGQVVFFNYSRCGATEDGRYLVPDDVFVIAIKESKAELFSELIGDWKDYSSTTSMSINLNAGVTLSFGSISGSFSTENSNVKKRQVNEKTVTSRVTLRYHLHAVFLQPDPQLHPKFKTRLLDIGAHLQNNNMAVARFLADILVRDYGTHYVTRVDSGGILSKVDHILKSYVASTTGHEHEVKVSASVSFKQIFNAGGSFSTGGKLNISDGYNKNLMDSEVHTYGGPPIKTNFTIADWEKNLPGNQVVMDREGDPLNYIITPEALPELPEEITFRLSALVLKSIERYYEMNVIAGCTSASSPNFNFQANFDDNSCKALLTNYTFGGVYQTCQSSGSVSFDPCKNYTQKNPKTQGYSCPKGYTAIHLHDGTVTESCQKSCFYFVIFKICSKKCGGGRFSTFWCAAEGKVPQNSGYLFGGLYSETTNNVITKHKGCPDKYYGQRFGPEGMYVCISDDYELASRYSIPFGGFMSCQSGNPLVIRSRKGLEGLTIASGPSGMPKRCPLGYSQHLAVIDGDCEILYCVRVNFLSSHGLANIKRPPFHRKPSRNEAMMFPLIIENNDTNKVYLREDGDNGHWVEFTPEMSMKMSMANGNPSESPIENLISRMETLKKKQSVMQSAGPSTTGGGLSTGATAGITVGATVVVGMIVIIIFTLRRRKKPSLNVDDHAGYQSFNSQGN